MTANGEGQADDTFLCNHILYVLSLRWEGGSRDCCKMDCTTVDI